MIDLLPSHHAWILALTDVEVQQDKPKENCMDIEKALRDENLDIQLRVEDHPNEWFKYAEIEARQLCDQFETPLHFTFNCDRKIQAYAVYSSNLVVVTAGLFDFLCRLADRIVSKGLFTEIGKPDMPIWTPDPMRPKETARKLIQDKPFDSASPAWNGDSDRKGLFFYLLLTMFRFVVLHEIGHFYHRHGARLSGVAAAVDVDTAQPRRLAPEAALDAQTRELVADKFAVDVLVKIFEAEVERIKQTSFTASLGTKLLDSEQKRVQFLLQAVYLYFSATDRLPGAPAEDAINVSHPPAAFRLVTIAAAVTENLDDEKTRKNALRFAIVADALIAVALDRNPDPAWLTHIQDPRFSDHYANLFERLDVWTRK